MWLPKWLKRIAFGSPTRAFNIVEHVARAGIRSIETRSVFMPPLVAFLVFDGEEVAAQTLHRPDVDPQVARELNQHLIARTKEFLESDDVPEKIST